MLPRVPRRPLIGLALLAAGVAAVFAADPPSASPHPAALPPDLALVPPSAVGFAHVRLADLWKHEGMKDVRGVFQKAGPKALAALDDHFTPAPSTIDRVTGVLFLGDPKEKPLLDGLYPAVIAHFTAPFDAAKVRTAHLPRAVSKSAGGKEYFLAEKEGVAVAFVGDRTIVLGDEDGVKAVLTPAGKVDSPLAPAVRAAATKHVVAALNFKALPIPPEAIEQIPEEYRPLSQATLATFTLDIAKEATADVRISYPTEAAAVDAEKALRKAANLGRVMINRYRQEGEYELERATGKGKEPAGIEKLPQAVAIVAALGALNTADEILADPPIKRDRADLAATATLPPWTTTYLASSAVAAGVLLPAVQKTREAAARAQSMNNLKQIAIALHNYHDTYGHFPPAAICDKKGKKLLSWRVAILPFIEQDAVYKQFKLDEPWDSEHNKRASQVRIKTFLDPRAPTPDTNSTYYKAVVGNGALWDPVTGTKINQITDGTSNTILTVAGGAPVHWASPDDVEFNPEDLKTLVELGRPFGGQLLIGMADGSVRLIDLKSRKDPGEFLKMLITKAGGEVVPNDF